MFNTCMAQGDATASNILNGQTRECAEGLAQYGISGDELRSMNKNIVQNASATATVGCSVQTMMENISKLSTSTDQQAVLKVLQESTGLLSGNTVNNNFCSNIDVTNDACTWMETQNCCSATANANATNLINSGCISDQINVTQNATANANATPKTCLAN